MAKHKHTAGILIIGSLIWDRREHRQSWWRDRLKAGPGIPVVAPIRYGRISTERSKTYTMVFSNELLPARTGWALVMPCRGTVSTADQLVTEAQALWAAEQPSRSKAGPLSARWGAVGLLPNPQITSLDEIRAGWTRRVAKEKRYAQFPHANNEQAAVSPDGILTIPWPTDESDVPVEMDLLIATATVPCPQRDGSYAPPEVIAEAWRRAPTEQRYFDENRRVGITTADDYRIMKYLCHESA